MPKLSDTQIAAAAQSAGFSGNHLAVAIAVALAESGGDPTATNKNNNGSTDYGLWQINSVHAALLRQGSWSNPADNARMAYAVYKQAGSSFSPWVAYKNGTYLAFMARAAVAMRFVAGAPTAVRAGLLDDLKELERKTDPDTYGGLPSPKDLEDLTDPNRYGFPDLSKITNFFSFISDPNNWKRVGLFFVGFILLVIAAFKLTGDNQLSGTTKGILKTVAYRKVAG